MNSTWNYEVREWTNSMIKQVQFHLNAQRPYRQDDDFDWSMIGTQPQFSINWFISNSELLWASRSLLEDTLSKVHFDSALLLKLSGEHKYMFPRTEFSPLFIIENVTDFEHESLPDNLLGIPLKVIDLKVQGYPNKIKLLSSVETIIQLNKYKQYLMRRDGINTYPVNGDIVLDCGSCIGDNSMLFAAMVGEKGAVHSFDPVPLHNQFCKLQLELSPHLKQTLYFNQVAVSDQNTNQNSKLTDITKISPGQSDIQGFPSVKIDKYVSDNLDKVDLIKMDIEGFEIPALNGAQEVIKTFKPKLAISAYHKPTDHWEIPILIKSIYPEYKIYFAHHSPVRWESVYYATT